MHSLMRLASVVVLGTGLLAGEGLVNVYRLDSASESYRLVIKDNFTFELTGPGGQQVTGNYVASNQKIGLVAGHLLRHFEYQLQNGDLLLRPSNTDGPEPNNVLGQMPPVQRGEQFTSYLTEAHHKQKYAALPAVQPPPAQPPAIAPPPAAPTLEPLLAQAQNDSQYYAYMAAGTKAFSEKKYSEARAHFIVAGRLKPEAAEAKDRLALCDGAQALAEGDALRQRGDWREAREAYRRAKQACPALGPIVDAQMPGFKRHGDDTPDLRQPMGALDAGIAQHLQQGRTADALRLATNAVQLEPTNPRLRTLKEGLEGLQTSETLHLNLKTSSPAPVPSAMPSRKMSR